MPTPLYVLRDLPLDGPTNMARDEHLLYDARSWPAVLRLYAWTPPTLSLGCFQRFADIETLPADVQTLPVVRRPTGGGAILHDREVTYALVLDEGWLPARASPAELYRLVHACWQAVLSPHVADLRLADEAFPPPHPRHGPFFCFEKPGRTDLLRGAHKVLGSAQRRIPGRVLQHGSLILGRRFAPHPGGHLDEPPPALLADWIAAFIGRLAEGLDLRPEPATWTPDQLAAVADRRRRYESDEWTRRH